MQAAFQLPPSKKYSFVKGKAVDLVVLTILGLVLIISVGISGVVKGFTDELISWLGLSGSVIGAPLVVAVGSPPRPGVERGALLRHVPAARDA